MWRGVFLAASALAAAALTLSTPAAAQNSDQSWINSAYASAAPVTNREFVREWEASPPKGRPTLSAGNVAPLKAAIKRYTEIVEKGGWQPIPDFKGKLAHGSSDPAVPLIRERMMSSARCNASGVTVGCCAVGSASYTNCTPPCKSNPSLVSR